MKCKIKAERFLGFYLDLQTELVYFYLILCIKFCPYNTKLALIFYNVLREKLIK